jgi:two-component system, LytTR family, response regulator
MIKAVIIDDEPLAISVVKEYLSSFKNIQIVQECANGFEGIKAIAMHQPELIFLDIQMPKINGFEMLELLDEPLPSVIFTTAFDEYAVKAFEVHAVDYLLKPFSKERFDKALNKWMEKQLNENSKNKTEELIGTTLPRKEEQHRVVVKSGNNIRIIPVQEIHFIEAYDDYVKINIAGDCFLKKKTMHYFEQSLSPAQFARVHRSFIVQLTEITRIELAGKDNHVAILKTGIKIPLSKSGYSRLKELLGLQS